MIQDRIIAVALAAEGMCGCKPTREQFRQWLGDVAPGWRYPLELPYGGGGMSLCSRVTEEFWRHAGVAVPPSWYPYGGGTFIRTHSWPASVGAIGDLRQLPGEGCAVWTASHFVGCIVAWFDPWSTELTYQDCWTVEGGGTCAHAGLQAIKRHHRRYWPDTGKGAWIADVVDGKVGARSRVLGWVDVERLPVG